MVKVSIIIPHFNSVALLKVLLSSIPNRSEIQIIVVDDRSDDSPSILKSDFPHVEFYSNTYGLKGAGACRNIGLSHAFGQWVLFGDADDYFTKNMFEIISEYFETDYDCIFFPFTSVYLDTGKIADRHQEYEKKLSAYRETPNEDTERIIRFQYPVPVGKLIRLSFIKNNSITFDEVLASNDVMFSTKVGFIMKKFHVANDIIYIVTRGKGTLTTNLSYSVFNSRFNVFLRYHNYLKKSLNKKDFKKLKLNGRTHFLRSIRFGLLQIIKTFIILKKHRVKLLDKRIFNPIIVLKKIKHRKDKSKRLKKYEIN